MFSEPLQYRPGAAARSLAALRAGVLTAAALACLPACGKKGAPLPPLPRTPPPPSALEGTLSGATLELAWSASPPAAPGQIRIAHDIFWRLEAPAPPSSPESKLERLMASGERAEGPTVEWGGSGGRRERRQKARIEVGPVPGGSHVQVAVVARSGRRAIASAPLTLEIPGEPPAELREFTAHLQPDGIRLTWRPESSGARVELLRGTEPSIGDPVLLARVEPGAGEFLDGSARLGVSYRYVARMRMAAGEGGWVTGPPASGTPLLYRDEFPPAAPRGLSLLAEGNDVRLLWSPNREPDLAGYRVRRRLGEAEEATVANVRAWEVTWVDTGLPPGARAVYRVTAFDASAQANESEPSQPAAAPAIGARPAGSPAREVKP